MDPVHAYWRATGSRRVGAVESVPGRVSLEIHRRFLTRYVRSGDRVLEVGAGPGRFTIQLAGLGARVLVTDISAAQLSRNKQRVADAGCHSAIEAFRELDLRDLSELADDSFDVALAYGGPLSHVFQEAERCFADLLRVTRPGDLVVASVMSLVGAYRHFLPEVADIDERLGLQANDEVIRTGDTRLVGSERGHVCRMFRWSELVALFRQHACRLVAASAGQWAALGPLDVLERIAADPEWWARFLDREEAMCAEPGVLDGGLHILFALEKLDP